MRCDESGKDKNAWFFEVVWPLIELGLDNEESRWSSRNLDRQNKVIAREYASPEVARLQHIYFPPKEPKLPKFSTAYDRDNKETQSSTSQTELQCLIRLRLSKERWSSQCLPPQFWNPDTTVVHHYKKGTIPMRGQRGKSHSAMGRSLWMATLKVELNTN